MLMLLLLSSCGNALRLPRQEHASAPPVTTSNTDVVSVSPVDTITNEPTSLVVFVCMMLVVLLCVIVTAFVGRRSNKQHNKQPEQTNKPHVIRD